MNNRKIIIIVSGLFIVAIAYFSMEALSGLKQNSPKRPPVEKIRHVNATPVTRNFTHRRHDGRNAFPIPDLA